jgi:hypothetical protein
MWEPQIRHEANALSNKQLFHAGPLVISFNSIQRHKYINTFKLYFLERRTFKDQHFLSETLVYKKKTTQIIVKLILHDCAWLYMA